MESKVIEALIERGLSGIAIVILLYAVTKLFVKYNEIQEKRIAENRESIKAIEQNTNALETLTEVLRNRDK